MTTKKELIKLLEPFDDDKVVVCMDCNGYWDNIEKVTACGSSIAIEFGEGSPFTDEKEESTTKKLAPKNNKEEGKPDLSLLPFSVLNLDSRAYEYGLYKYEKYSWMEGFKTSNLTAATLRHITDYFWKGERFDKKALKDGFKVHHLAAARFNLASIIHAELEGLGMDDRPCHKLNELRKLKNIESI